MADIYEDIKSLQTTKDELLARLHAEEKTLNDNLAKVQKAIAAITGAVVKTRKKRGPNKVKAAKAVKKTKRTMSPEAKAKIAAAQKKRWAAFHAKKKK